MRSVSPFEVSRCDIGAVGFRSRPAGIKATGKAFQIHRNFEQTGQAGEADQVMRMALSEAFHGLVRDGHPKRIGSQFAFHITLYPRRGQRRGPFLRKGWTRFTAVDPGKDGFPLGHPAALPLALAALTFDDYGIEEGGREAGEPVMGPERAAKGDQGVAEVIRGAPAHAHDGTGDAPRG